MSFSFVEFSQRLDKALDHVSRDVASLRTGKATVQLLDPVFVEAYGSKMRVSEVATVQAPDATLIVISPWDKSLLAAIERAIATSDLNLNPVVNGDVIRIQIAPLTEEKRKEMVKVLHKKIENGRVMFRNLRTDVKKEVEAQKGSQGVSEDDIEFDLQKLEEIFKEFMNKLDALATAKEKDLMTI